MISSLAQWLKESIIAAATAQVAAVARIQSLVWELPCVMGAAIKLKKKKKTTTTTTKN